MGGSSEVLAAALRAGGLKARALPLPDAQDLALGRRHTSGKECLPMSITLGGLLRYLQEHPAEGITFMMPRSCGPCRLGMYRLLDEIVLEQTGARARI
jgi:predicted nucleotide-binding protein (sugar kinase/HSP70/actin superfamily)